MNKDNKLKQNDDELVSEAPPSPTLTRGFADGIYNIQKAYFDQIEREERQILAMEKIANAFESVSISMAIWSEVYRSGQILAKESLRLSNELQKLTLEQIKASIE